MSSAECAAMIGVPPGVFERNVAPSISRPYTAPKLSKYIRGASGIERATIPQATRVEVHRRDGWRCVRCGTGDDLTIDHIKPWSLGGADTVANFQTLCGPCNSRKGARWSQ